MCVCISASLYIVFIYLFFTPPLTPSLISLPLISPHPLNFSPGATVCVHPVAAATAGGHTSWWVNKRPRDPHPQRDGKSNFIFFFSQRGEGGGGATECTQRGRKKNEEEVEAKEEEGRMDGRMDRVGEMSS